MDGRDDLVDLAVAAKLLAVNRNTLRRWLRQGRIPAFQYGPHGLYRIRRGDLLVYLEANRLPRQGEARDGGAAPKPDAG